MNKSLNRTVGIHAWEPGLTAGNTSASSGGSAWLRYLIDSLAEADCQVAWISDYGAHVDGCDTYSCEVAARVCDLVIIMWRWQMPNYPERQLLYDEQWKLIRACVEQGTRVAVHDQDHQISPADADLLRLHDIHTYAPEVAPRPGVTRLMYPNPFVLLDPFTVADWRKDVDIVYVGNNYERLDQAEWFLSTNRGMDANVSIKMYGNWLEPNPSRESPDEVRMKLPNVKFMGRLPQPQLLDALGSAYYTIHLFKDSYAKPGFVTMRWAEAAAAGTLAFIPFNFTLPYDWERQFEHSHTLVHDAREVAFQMGHFSRSLVNDRGWYQSALRLQANFVKHYMTIDRWLKLVKGEI